MHHESTRRAGTTTFHTRLLANSKAAVSNTLHRHPPNPSKHQPTQREKHSAATARRGLAGKSRLAAARSTIYGGQPGVHAAVAAGPRRAEPGGAAAVVDGRPLLGRAAPPRVALAALVAGAARLGGAAVAGARAGLPPRRGRRALGPRHRRRVRRALLHGVLLLPLLRLHAMIIGANPPPYRAHSSEAEEQRTPLIVLSEIRLDWLVRVRGGNGGESNPRNIL